MQLSVLTSFSVAVLLLILTLTLSYNAAQQVRALAMADMQNQVDGIGDMASMLNTSLREEVSNYSQLFRSYLPGPFSLDESRNIQVGSLSTPTLRAGVRQLNLDQALVDDFQQRTGAIATIFVRSGDEFVRISTSLRKENGERALATRLDHNSPAWQPLHKGEVFQGVALLFGKRYITQYQPLRDKSGRIIAIQFIGMDISKQYHAIREKVLAKHLGDSGSFYVLNSTAGPIAVSICFILARKVSCRTCRWRRSSRYSVSLRGRLNVLMTRVKQKCSPGVICPSGIGWWLARFTRTTCWPR